MELGAGAVGPYSWSWVAWIVADEVLSTRAIEQMDPHMERCGHAVGEATVVCAVVVDLQSSMPHRMCASAPDPVDMEDCACCSSHSYCSQNAIQGSEVIFESNGRGVITLLQRWPHVPRVV